MKNIILIIIAVIILGLGVFVSQTGAPSESGEEYSTEQQEALVTAYIQEHISDLSPVSEVLGGTFRVLSIEFTDGNSGVVEYEDGHIALVADFVYTIDREGMVEVEFTHVEQ